MRDDLKGDFPMSTTTVAILLVVSWLFIFVGLFVHDRMNRRLVTLQVTEQYLLRAVMAIADKQGISMDNDAFTQDLLRLLGEGKTYEALAVYRTVKGVSYHEAKAYIDSLRAPK